jgi:glycosyltransferase involved in cell wall biosynthesis
MRVLLVIDDLRRAGAQRVIAQEARALHPRFVVFRVAALARHPEPTFVSELRGLGVSVEYIPGSGLLDVRRVTAIAQLIDRLQPDLVHTHLSYANILGTLGARQAHRPVVASLHNVDSNQLKWAMLKRLLEGSVLRRWAARIVIVSEGAVPATARNFGVPLDRTVVLPNAVENSSVYLPTGFDRARKRSELGASRGERLVCTVGRLEPSKGQRFLLHALAELRSREREPRVRLVLVGAGPDRDDLRRLAEGVGLADCVALLGARDDVAEVVAASDLFVLPSLNEGLSQALLEAMALGTPVVATEVGGTPDVLEPGRTGWCVPPAQPVALAEAIQQALGNPRDAAACADAARAHVAQKFNHELHLARLRALYAGVARNAAEKPMEVTLRCDCRVSGAVCWKKFGRKGRTSCG